MREVAGKMGRKGIYRPCNGCSCYGTLEIVRAITINRGGLSHQSKSTKICPASYSQNTLVRHWRNNCTNIDVHEPKLANTCYQHCPKSLSSNPPPHLADRGFLQKKCHSTHNITVYPMVQFFLWNFERIVNL